MYQYSHYFVFDFCVHMSISLGENGWQCHHPFWGVSNLNTRKKLSSLGGDVIESRHCWSRHSWAQTSRNLGVSQVETGQTWPVAKLPSLPFGGSTYPCSNREMITVSGRVQQLYCLELRASEIKLSEWAGRTSKTDTPKAKKQSFLWGCSETYKGS